jgi:hypothetical protein
MEHSDVSSPYADTAEEAPHGIEYHGNGMVTGGGGGNAAMAIHNNHLNQMRLDQLTSQMGMMGFQAREQQQMQQQQQQYEQQQIVAYQVRGLCNGSMNDTCAFWNNTYKSRNVMNVCFRQTIHLPNFTSSISAAPTPSLLRWRRTALTQRPTRSRRRSRRLCSSSSSRRRRCPRTPRRRRHRSRIYSRGSKGLDHASGSRPRVQ